MTLLPLTCNAQNTHPPLNALTRGILTNGGVITLANAGFSEAFIVQLINMSPQNFDVAVDALADLARNGLTEPIIGAMMKAARPSQQIPAIDPPPSTRTGLATPYEPVLSQKISHISDASILLPDDNEPANAVVSANGHRTLKENPRFFLAEIANGLDGFLAAEIIKQHLPITVTVDESQSDYILTGNSLRTLDSYRPYRHAKDRNEGNAALIDTQNQQVIWAGEAGDRSLWFSLLKRGDQRKLAGRIVSRMKKDLFH